MAAIRTVNVRADIDPVLHRLRALELAVQVYDPTKPRAEQIVEDARVFEAYLRGEDPVTE